MTAFFMTLSRFPRASITGRVIPVDTLSKIVRYGELDL
jgi:hypothetical protein